MSYGPYVTIRYPVLSSFGWIVKIPNRYISSKFPASEALMMLLVNGDVCACCVGHITQLSGGGKAMD